MSYRNDIQHDAVDIYQISWVAETKLLGELQFSVVFVSEQKDAMVGDEGKVAQLLILLQTPTPQKEKDDDMSFSPFYYCYY